MELKADVVVIGAGLAGLYAASKLSPGLDVVVLEARDRVGGRTYSVPYSNENKEECLDKGAGWVGRSQKKWLAVASELGVKTFPQHYSGTGVLMLSDKNQNARIINMLHLPCLGGLLPLLKPWELVSLQVGMLKIDSLSQQVPVNAPWRAPYAHEWDHMSVGAWLTENVSFEAVRTLMTTVIEGFLLQAVSEVSLLWFLFYVASAGGIRALSDEAQDYRVVTGSQNICTLLAERLQRNNDVLGSARRRIVHLQHVVEAVHDFADLDGPGAVVEASSPAGPISIRARCVIVALSPRLLGRIRFSSPVPRATLGKYWYGGTGVKWTISYRAPFWRAKGLSGLIVHSAGVPWVFDGCSQSGTGVCLIGFSMGAAAQGDKAQRKEKVLSILQAALGPEARSEALIYTEMEWPGEQWTDACVNGTPPNGTLVTHGSTYFQRRFGKLIWAGAEIAARWNGYMEGALWSAEAAAEEASWLLKQASTLANATSMLPALGSDGTAALLTQAKLSEIKSGDCKSPYQISSEQLKTLSIWRENQAAIVKLMQRILLWPGLCLRWTGLAFLLGLMAHYFIGSFFASSITDSDIWARYVTNVVWSWTAFEILCCLIQVI